MLHLEKLVFNFNFTSSSIFIFIFPLKFASNTSSPDGLELFGGEPGCSGIIIDYFRLVIGGWTNF